MINSEEYVIYMLDSLKDENIERFMLPDTLGILNPEQTYNFCKKIVDRYPNLSTLIFTLIMIMIWPLPMSFQQLSKAGIKRHPTTINGLGERAGNVLYQVSSEFLTTHLMLKRDK